MTELDTLIARDATGTSTGLDSLEHDVWSRVKRVQAKARERSLRVTALGVAAAIGGITGGVMAPVSQTSPTELSIFSPRLAASPLDVRSALG
jgi:hypothetical protein